MVRGIWGGCSNPATSQAAFFFKFHSNISVFLLDFNTALYCSSFQAEYYIKITYEVEAIFKIFSKNLTHNTVH
jgi:hypothetical protein